MLAGGLGGSSGDMLMHSIDTVKTRQQGGGSQPHSPPSLPALYTHILRTEGLRRGLYAGVTPAFWGSFPGTIIFFGTYEYSKRGLLDLGANATLAYLAGGFLADLAASVVYVPSEVLKTRLQLQGRYNNPFTARTRGGGGGGGYNYRSTYDAARTIVRSEGAAAMFGGYKATIFRDLPFSALQFAFYEQEQEWARWYVGRGREIGWGWEVVTASSAGGVAGVMTCPLDVVKTRIQTQVNPTEEAAVRTGKVVGESSSAKRKASEQIGARGEGTIQQQQQQQQKRGISTSSPSTSVPKSDAVKLETESVMMGLRLIYKTEGVVGLFRGVGPRAVWTSVQSGTMLVLYQVLLRRMAASPWFVDEGGGVA